MQAYYSPFNLEAMKRKVYKTEVVEVTIPTNTTQVSFPLGTQYTNLEKGLVVAVEVCKVADVEFTPKGVKVANDSIVKNAFIELYESGRLTLNKVPLNRLVIGPSVTQDPLDLNPFKIDLSNSKIVLSKSGFASAVNDEAFLLIFYYE